MKRRGFSIAELMVSCMILGLLLAMLFSLFQSGANAWAKVDAHSDLLSTFETQGARWEGDVKQSGLNTISVSASNDTMSFARPVLTTAPGYTLGPDGSLVWKSFRVYYYNAGQVFVRDLDLPTPGNPVNPLPQLDLGTGPHPLAFYRAAGRPVLSLVTACRWQLVGAAVRWSLTGQKARYGSQQAEQFSVEFQSVPRN